MDFNTLKTLLIRELVGDHGCHTVILYGSRARGDATERSDVDVLGIRETGDTFRIGRPWRGLLLDAWVYSQSNLPKVDDLLYIKDGVVIQDHDGFGSSLLTKIRAALATPPKPLPAWDRELRVTWIDKMLDRAGVGDAEGDYRRHWLLFELLETFFLFSNQRYPGPKESLKQLELNDPGVFTLFQAALKPGADLATIRNLSDAVIERGESGP